MRSSDFWRLMDAEFGSAYAHSLARDHVLGSLRDRTAEQALADHEDPRTVWLALCVDLDVPPERRWGWDARSAGRSGRR